MYFFNDLFLHLKIIILVAAYILFILYVIVSVTIAGAIYIKVAKSYISYRKEIKFIEKQSKL